MAKRNDVFRNLCMEGHALAVPPNEASWINASITFVYASSGQR